MHTSLLPYADCVATLEKHLSGLISCKRPTAFVHTKLAHAFAAGNRTSQALLGLQLVPGQQAAFNEVIQELEAEFTFTTLPEDARRVFDMFIQ